MPLRVMPQVGLGVTVVYLADRARGVIGEILDDGRRLLVHTDDGETISFTLSRATATFTAPGIARLVFEAPG